VMPIIWLTSPHVVTPRNLGISDSGPIFNIDASVSCGGAKTVMFYALSTYRPLNRRAAFGLVLTCASCEKESKSTSPKRPPGTGGGYVPPNQPPRSPLIGPTRPSPASGPDTPRGKPQPGHPSNPSTPKGGRGPVTQGPVGGIGILDSFIHLFVGGGN
jgi:hypothetical protein